MEWNCRSIYWHHQYLADFAPAYGNRYHTGAIQSPKIRMEKVIIIGGGVAGLASAIRCAVKGYEVDVFESQATPGGKLAEIKDKGFRFDAGPSLFTLPHLVDELFELAGKNPRDYFSYSSLPIITRYFYEDGSVINAWQNIDDFAKEIEEKTSESAQKVHRLLKKSREKYEITSHVFLERSLHRWQTYLRWPTLKSALQLHKLDAFRSMHKANAATFKDPRVVQLFDRYATYNGSDPYQAPATLNIIPHLEHNLGAWLPDGGMYQITESLFKLAKELGVHFHFNRYVDEILVEKKKVNGIRIGQNHIPAEYVISNVDIVPTYRNLLPTISPPERILKQARSSSALIFYWGIDQLFPELDVHNIFFSKDYRAEFEHLWQKKSIYEDPTVYLYISSKHHPSDAPAGKENWFVMINVPPDDGQHWEKLIQETKIAIIQKLSRMLQQDLENLIKTEHILDPRNIASRTSSFQGALYGNSSNNRFTAFLRHPNFSRKIKGLYFCGGSVHPGGGIPLCLLSARIAVSCM